MEQPTTSEARLISVRFLIIAASLWALAPFG